MKRRTRNGLFLISAIVFLLVIHFFYVLSLTYFDHQRALARFNSYAKLLFHFNTLNLIDSPHASGRESWEQGEYPMSPLVRNNEDGKPLYSWRFAEYLTWPVPLPHDYHWTSEKYRHYRETVSLYLFCEEGDLNTFVFAMGGADTAFDQNHPAPVRALPEDLILFADVYQSNTHWMEPGDFDIANLPDEVNVPGGLGSDAYPGFLICFVDGQIWWMDDETPITLVKQFCTISGARKADRKILAPYCGKKMHANQENLQWLIQKPEVQPESPQD